jgi:hypothetical protein
LGNARLNTFITLREDLNFGLLPKVYFIVIDDQTVKILILQHSSDGNTLFIGALRKKNDIKLKGDSKQKGIEEYDFVMIKSQVDSLNFLQAKKNIWNLKTSGSSKNGSEFDELSTKNLVYSYLSSLSESKEISNFGKLKYRGNHFDCSKG